MYMELKINYRAYPLIIKKIIKKSYDFRSGQNVHLNPIYNPSEFCGDISNIKGVIRFTRL